MAASRDAQWAQLLALPEQPGLPLQGRMRQAVVQAILDGRLWPGARLPSSRALADALGLSRNTVTSALQQLCDEHYLEARPRSGLFVLAHNRPDVAQQADPPQGAAAAAPDWRTRVLRSQRQRPTLRKPLDWNAYPYPFVYGRHDPQLFPTEDFRECCMRSLARSRLPHWTPDLETGDVPELLEQIRTRLLPRRGVFALDSEILITLGAQQAYYLLSETLFSEYTRVGLEDPGHPHARNSFALRNPRFAEVRVDGDGVMIDDIPALEYLFVTPSHQSPTTVTLSLQRRQQLLQRAQQRDFVVIEDDYEAENLYDGRPMPALKSLDRSGRVIYVGSISKSLSPALRLGYVVAPRELIEEMRPIRHAMLRHPSTFLQHTFALFLSMGHHESHTRRVNQVMRERVEVVCHALRAELPQCHFHPPQGGASVWVQTPEGVDGAALARQARAHGVLIEPGDVFFGRPPEPCGYFRLRLSSIDTAAIAPGIAALARAMQELTRTRAAAGSATHADDPWIADPR